MMLARTGMTDLRTGQKADRNTVTGTDQPGREILPDPGSY